MYTGRDLKEASFANFTDSYIQLNTQDDSGYINTEPEAYFGVPEAYTQKFQDFKDNKIQSTPDFIAFDNLLLGSFYEFVYKLAMLDLSNQKQFENFEAALKHPFVNYSGFQITKSDS